MFLCFLTVTFTHGVIPKVKINREKAARYGMNVADVQLFVSSALGGAKVGETVEGVARYPITLRYPADLRDNLEAVRNLPVLTPLKQSITLSDVAEIRVTTGAPMIKTENAADRLGLYRCKGSRLGRRCLRHQKSRRA